MGSIDTHAFNVGGLQFSMIAERDSIVAHIRSGQDFEKDTLALWDKLCALAGIDGGTVIDVGAHTGIFTVIAALRGCNVIAIEPMTFNLERLRQNLLLNRCGDKVRIIEGVASDHDGMSGITFNPKVKDRLTSGASIVRKTGERVAVKSITLDGLGLTDCRAIKMDVERAEPLVLAGAQKLMKRFHPLMIIEVLDAARANEVAALTLGYMRKSVLDVRNWIMVPC